MAIHKSKIPDPAPDDLSVSVSAKAGNKPEHGLFKTADKQHPAWNSFVKFSRYNVSPGKGSGHLVTWYWQIYKQGWEEAVTAAIALADQQDNPA